MKCPKCNLEGAYVQKKTRIIWCKNCGQETPLETKEPLEKEPLEYVEDDDEE